MPWLPNTRMRTERRKASSTGVSIYCDWETFNAVELSPKKFVRERIGIPRMRLYRTDRMPTNRADRIIAAARTDRPSMILQVRQQLLVARRIAFFFAVFHCPAFLGFGQSREIEIDTFVERSHLPRRNVVRNKDGQQKTNQGNKQHKSNQRTHCLHCLHSPAHCRAEPSSVTCRVYRIELEFCEAGACGAEIR